MNACEKHPQRQEIIDSIIAGEALRKIAARLKPPVSQATVGRFKLKVLKIAVSSLRPHGVNSNLIKQIADGNPNIATEHGASSAYQDQMRRVIERRVEARLSRREGWISEAEKRPIKDKDGNVYNDMDHRALAAHDKNEGGDLEFLAKLGGLLQDNTKQSTGDTYQILVMPRYADERDSSGDQVIDVVSG